MNPLLFLKGISPTTWIMIGMGIVIAVLMGSLWVQNVRLDSAKNEISALTLKNEDLTNKIMQQNEGIKSLHESKKTLENNLANARKLNAKRQQELENALNKIRSQSVPDDTAGRLEYVLDAFSENAEKWNSKQ